jgi:hypothetical protein
VVRLPLAVIAIVASGPSIEEKMDVREVIRGRKESVVVKGTKVL